MFLTSLVSSSSETCFTNNSVGTVFDTNAGFEVYRPVCYFDGVEYCIFWGGGGGTIRRVIQFEVFMTRVTFDDDDIIGGTYIFVSSYVSI